MTFSGEALLEARKRVSTLAHRTAEYSNVAAWDPYDAGVASAFWQPEFGTGAGLDRAVREVAVDLKEEIFGRRLYAVVPVYVTSICSERCLYCNYRVGNRGVELQRLRLSSKQLEAEVRHLAGDKGLRVVELVYATDPVTRISRMCRDVEGISRLLDEYGGGTVGINAEALDETEYRQLVGAGLNFAVLWQETYDQRRYSELHPGSTKKSRFEYRIDAIERMIAAGIEAVGMGVLSGLSSWREDWAMLMEHEAYLKARYDFAPSILGVPRLKPAAGAIVQRTATTPTVQEFKAVVALHNLFSPTSMPFLNTREAWDVCVDMAAGGGALFTFNCCTIPGGYAGGTRGYQFPTGSYDASVFAPQLVKRGMRPVFAWRFERHSVVSVDAELAALSGP